MSHPITTKSRSLCSPSLTHGSLRSAFCLPELDDSRDLTKVSLYGPCVCVTGLRPLPRVTVCSTTILLTSGSGNEECVSSREGAAVKMRAATAQHRCYSPGVPMCLPLGLAGFSKAQSLSLHLRLLRGLGTAGQGRKQNSLATGVQVPSDLSVPVLLAPSPAVGGNCPADL